jgi:formylmethanofuran dehydrogenase subunit E
MLSFNIAPVNRKEDLVAAKSQAMQALSEHDKLASEVHRLTMLLESVWTVLKKKTGLTDEELKTELKAIKLKHAEAAAKSEPGKCVSCGKAIALNSAKCVFCGTVQEKEKLF